MKIYSKNTNFYKQKNKRITHVFVVLCILFFITSCSSDEDADPPTRHNSFVEMESCGPKIGKKFGLDYLFVSNIHKTYKGFFFKSHKFINLDEGRILIIKIVHDYVSQIEKSKFILRRLKYEEENYRKKEFNKKYLKNYFTIRISFWDKKYDKPKSPYLSEIYLCEGEVYYYEADPVTQEKILILKEPIEELSSKNEHHL